MFYYYVGRPEVKQQLLNERFSCDIKDLNQRKINDVA